MNRKRMLELADVIERRAIPGLKFDMRLAYHPPTHSACIAGWAVAWFDSPAALPHGGLLSRAREILDLTEEEAEELFFKLDATPNLLREMAAR